MNERQFYGTTIRNHIFDADNAMQILSQCLIIIQTGRVILIGNYHNMWDVDSIIPCPSKFNTVHTSNILMVSEWV